MSQGRLAASQLVNLLGDWRPDHAPAYEALADRIRLLLIDGRISVDVRLPSERETAERLALSRTTVTAAYRLLRESGHARSVQGSGTTTMLPASPRRRGHHLDLVHASLPATALLAGAAREAAVDLDRYLAETGYYLSGIPELRTAIAARYTARGLPTEPENIAVTTGAQGAIALLATSLVARGDRVYAESPSYPHAFEAFRRAGGRVVTSPVTPQSGWDIEALETAFARTTPTTAYVQPDFQNPTGRSMTPADRDRLLAAAARIDCTVIADETMGDLAIDHVERQPPLAAAADRHGARVIHVGSASKLFWGGLRLGWIRAERDLLQRLAAFRPASDLGTPVLDQLVAARLIPRTDEVIAERRGQLRERRATAYAGFAALLPDWVLPAQLHGGLVAWVQLPAPVSSALTLAARARGLHITAGPRFGVDGAYERFLRFPLTASPDALGEAIRTLADAWPQVTHGPAAALALDEAVV